MISSTASIIEDSTHDFTLIEDIRSKILLMLIHFEGPTMLEVSCSEFAKDVIPRSRVNRVASK